MLGEDFEWRRGHTPLSHPAWPAAAVVCYLGFILVAKRALRRPVFIPSTLTALHNIILSLGSLVMFAGCLHALIEACRGRGAVDIVFCTPVGTRPAGRLWFWSYVYYLSKFYEFLDTFLLVLKQKPTSFLHVMHHALVVVMSWLWVDQVQSLQFGGLLTNTAVHVVMYYYYFLTVLGRSPWWKKYITTLQILQFVSSFLTIPIFLIYQFKLMRDQGGCAGLGALAFNAAFNFALLLLFIQFYAASYKKAKAR